ncbi:cytochrome P450 [Favolaschia claudopus]|uniref:Cytochrome P450 n=1 Tax=Favolaschia claudopus TaxID=2862362 RepID=A0AAW0CYZ6_9AGAR
MPDAPLTDIVLACIAFIYLAYHYALDRGHRTPQLRGPPSNNPLFGLVPTMMSVDSGDICEEWAARYGLAFTVPAILGSKWLVIGDPKALAHLIGKEPYGYVRPPAAKSFQEELLGKGLFTAEGDEYTRQRKTLNQAFTSNAVKDLMPIFFESAYKVGCLSILLFADEKHRYQTKAAWDTMIENEPAETKIIEVQRWMNHISLDTIGLAGFSHAFNTLSGHTTAITSAFESLGRTTFFETCIAVLSVAVPLFNRIPTRRRRMMNQLTETMQQLGEEFLGNARRMSREALSADKSVIGLLAKSANAEKIKADEVTSQINLLLLAGYESTATKVSFTWSLIELARNPAIQTRLREELLKLGRDPTWEELNNQETYLDAFASEILRLHPPLGDLYRMAAQDDVLPLSQPIRDANGKVLNSVFVKRGTTVVLAVQCINSAEAYWGRDSKKFMPERWLVGTTTRGGMNLKGVRERKLGAQDIKGYRHLLSFSDGARICPGKTFAVMELKIALSVLVRYFTFEFPKGPDTAIGRERNILLRPKVVGEEGYDVPLRVGQYMTSN